MIPIRNSRVGALLFLAIVATYMLHARPAFAASQLSAIRIGGVRGGSTRVTLLFAGGIPAGWHVTGTGTPEATIILPGTTPGPGLRGANYQGLNALQSISVTPVANELDVALHLKTEVQLATSTTPAAIFVDIAPQAASTPAFTLPLRPAISPSAPTYGGEHSEVVTLKYADVSEVAGVLDSGEQIPPNDMFEPSGSIFSLPSSQNGVPSTQPAQSVFSQGLQQPQSFAQRINDNVAIDRRLNAVVLTGTPQEIARDKQTIAEIDVPVPSVMLSCQVVELSETAARDLGLDFTTGPSGPSAGGTVTIQSNNTPQFHVTLQASLFAAIAHGGGKILATPRILAMNGTQAQILTGDALPIIQTTIYPGSPAITQTTVNYIAVGVDLQIQPRITTDGYVTSHVFAEVSSVTAFVPTPQGNVPQISLRQATTMATVKDDEPFVIGGLLQDEEIDNMSKVPGLGDLPLIGGMFRVRHDTTTRTNLYVIVTPHVIEQAGRNPGPVTPVPQVPLPVR